MEKNNTGIPPINKHVPNEHVPEIDANLEKSVLLELLYQLLAKPNIMPTTIKPLEFCEAEAREHIHTVFDQLMKDLALGEDLFLKAASPEEKTSLSTIFGKLTEIPLFNDNQFPLDLPDAILLDKIARRELAAEHFETASSMFRYLLMRQPNYDSAWVGCAIAEQLQNHIQNADDIYSMALQLYPKSYLISSFAADFFLANHHPKKAIQILENAVSELMKNGMEASKELKQMSELLEQLK